MRILLRSLGGDWRRADPRAYVNEDELQALLKRSPEIIPRNPPDLPHVVYCREFPVGDYAVDLVGVGSDGSVSLIECKLAHSREAKRTVVGQVLEYAAGMWRMGPAEFERAFASRTGIPPLDGIRDARLDGWDEAVFRERLGDNLARGSFRILIAVDRISPELRGIIEYVNSRPGDLRLVGLELPYFTDGNFEILIPETYGDELKVTAYSGRRDTAPPPTVEEHLAQHPEARTLHDRVASVLPDHYTTTNQISYRGRVGDRSISVIQLYLPQRRIYFAGSPELAINEAGGDLKALLDAAQKLGFRTTPTSVEWPEKPGERMDALVDLLADRFLRLFRRP
jgi:hypothetical protein